MIVNKLSNMEGAWIPTKIMKYLSLWDEQQ